MPTVRIEAYVHQRLRDLAEQSGESMQAVLAQAIENERRRRFLESINAAYASLSTEERASLEQEHEAWNCTLLDGIPQEG